ncbi:MAG: membrane dipeptidase [Pseudomonadota bacterium]
MRWLKRIVVSFLILLAVAAVSFFTFGPGIAENQQNKVVPHQPYTISPSAQALHDSLLIGDLHADTLLWKRDLTKRWDRGHTDIPRLLEGNVGLQIYTAVTKSPAGQNYIRNSAEARDNITLLAIGQLWPVRTWYSLLERTLYQAEKLHRFEAEMPESVKIIKSLQDLEDVLERRARGEKVIGFILGIEGAHPLVGKIENLNVITDAGYRLIGLQHFFDNELGGSLHGEANNGLTDFGRQVVKAIAEQNLILDVAHSSEQVVRDVLEITDIPIVVSHTGIRSHCDVHRNIPDELMRQIAARGGLIGIGFWKDVTCDDTPMGIAAAIKAAISVVGEDHVSLGSDYDGTVTVTFDASELAVLTQSLLEIGLSETQIRKVMGENMVRLLRQRLGNR